MISVLFLSLIAAVKAESRVSFDFGWKFSLGATHIPEQDLCPESAWNQDLDGFYCEGWGHQAAYQLTEDECRLYCCGDPACAGYSWGKGFCVVGSNLSQCIEDSSKGFRGKGRRTPAPMVAPSSRFEERSYDDSAWDSIDVPHDFVVTVLPSADAEKNHGYRFKNISFYRKHFQVDATNKGKAIFLEFDGIYRSSDVWLNGIFLGHHASGYTQLSFRIDEDKYGLKYDGDNVVAIRVDPRANEGWWYEGGGIYRHTWLRFASPVHGKQLYIAPTVTGPISSQPSLTASASAPMEVTVENLGKSSTSVEVTFTITKKADGSLLWHTTTAAQAVPASGEAVFKATAEIQGMELWDLDSPSLHVLTAEVMTGSQTSGDQVKTTFGVRKAEFDAEQGFFLNGRNLKVKGMCNHQDFAGIGTAVPDSLSAFRIEMLKSFGVNAWRMSHNPPNPELLDKADELGMLIWDENRFLGDHATWYDDMRDMILRDRNHPSIIWWSLCNEFGCNQLSGDVTISVGKKFRALVKELDTSRPISGAWSGDMSTGKVWGEEVCDMMGINYNYKAFASYHKDQPKTPLISSESCSCTSDRTYKVDNSEALIGAYHAWSCIRDCWAIIANTSYIQGSFDWTGFDYRGEETPSSWPAINSHFGVLDLAGFMKDDAYYYKGWYDTYTPLVHITPPNWNYDAARPSPSGGVVRVMDCQGGGDIQQWKFDVASASSGAGSTIESVHAPGQCIRFVAEGSASYPIKTAPCKSTAEDDALLFAFDAATGEVMPKGHEGKICLDVNGDGSGTVGFWQCKNGSPDGNQKFSFADGVLTSHNAQLPGTCVAYVDGSVVQVWVYTNGDEVELLLNGKSLGKQAVPMFEKGSFSVVFEEGELTAKVTKRGQSWGNDTIRTAGSPAAIIATLDELMASNDVVADGQDAMLITATLVDSEGVVVRHLDPELTFTVDGPGRLIGLGNGNPSDHDDDKGKVRRIFNGKVRAVVQAGKTPGTVTVTASSNGMKSGSVSFKTRSPNEVYV